ncbi:MAG: hypothetical protein WKG07_00530 [Hymenobacter sp.]
MTLKPPVLSDTTIALKNPLSFPQAHDAARWQLYAARHRARPVHTPPPAKPPWSYSLTVAAPTAPAFSDIVFLARPAAKASAAGTFNRGGYLLTRAPGGAYGRGADNMFFYTELNASAGRPSAVRLHYHLAAPDGTAADADAPPVTAQAGRPTPLVGQLPLGPLPEGPSPSPLRPATR